MEKKGEKEEREGGGGGRERNEERNKGGREKGEREGETEKEKGREIWEELDAGMSLQTSFSYPKLTGIERRAQLLCENGVGRLLRPAVHMNPEAVCLN